jgi:hypothetical protein
MVNNGIPNQAKTSSPERQDPFRNRMQAKTRVRCTDPHEGNAYQYPQQWLFKNKIIYNLMIVVATKNDRTKIIFAPLFWYCCLIRYPGWRKIRVPDPG